MITCISEGREMLKPLSGGVISFFFFFEGFYLL